MVKSTTSGSFSEGAPLAPKAEAKVVRPDTVLSENFVAIRNASNNTIALMPIGWVGEPALVFSEKRLDDLKACLNKL